MGRTRVNNLALFTATIQAFHIISPICIIAAHSPSHCFDAAFTAGKLALEHMMPVILMSEGFIANGSEPWKIPAMADYPAIKPPFIESCEGHFNPYERDPETYVRKWAIPGKKGLEHRVGGLEKNPLGVISSDPENHARMVADRAEKVARVANYIPELEVHGKEKGDVLVVGWGGTFGHLYTAVKTLQAQGKSVSLAHFDFINPLPKNTDKVLGGFSKIIVCELNSGQFVDYLRAKMPQFNYLQYNKVQGQPFIVSEIVDAVNAVL
ncbi:MAG: hypothetical protein IJS02_02740 [Bacteroidales bacterium]|nr:hypothetical protein [Bacteroidales bacterium]